MLEDGQKDFVGHGIECSTQVQEDKNANFPITVDVPCYVVVDYSECSLCRVMGPIGRLADRKQAMCIGMLVKPCRHNTKGMKQDLLRLSIKRYQNIIIILVYHRVIY